MAKDGEQSKEQEPKTPKKGVAINIMFPCEDDAEAFRIKGCIDAVISDIKEKRYTFNITEM